MPNGSKPIPYSGNHNNTYLPHGIVLKISENMFVKKQQTGGRIQLRRGLKKCFKMS